MMQFTCPNLPQWASPRRSSRASFLNNQENFSTRNAYAPKMTLFGPDAVQPLPRGTLHYRFPAGSTSTVTLASSNDASIGMRIPRPEPGPTPTVYHFKGTLTVSTTGATNNALYLAPIVGVSNRAGTIGTTGGTGSGVATDLTEFDVIQHQFGSDRGLVHINWDCLVAMDRAAFLPSVAYNDEHDLWLYGFQAANIAGSALTVNYAAGCLSICCYGQETPQVIKPWIT